MTQQEAHSLATAFVNRLNENRFLQDHHSGAIPFVWSFGDMIEFPSCYYFDWKMLHSNGDEFTEPPLAGPPGFIISKPDGNAEIISHVSLIELQLEEKRKDELFVLLTSAKEGDGNLSKIKSTYDLSSKEILLFLKALQQESFDRNTVTDKLHEILKKVKPNI
jgi:hypothetical protein